jgi:putative NADPH-quinone reductase
MIGLNGDRKDWNMAEPVRIVGILGTYRSDGVVERALDEVLEGARLAGAEVAKIDLRKRHVEFCTNCRHCTQEPGETRGDCPRQDDMAEMLDQMERADGLVLASPVNFFTVTALMKRFIERQVCYAWWPWGNLAPKRRRPSTGQRAVVVTACAMPAPLARLFTNAPRLLRTAAELPGARTIGTLIVGQAAKREHLPLPPGIRRRARRLGRQLALGRR